MLPKKQGIAVADGRLFKLRKSLNGLRHALKLWYQMLSSIFWKVGFHLSKYSDCLFLGCSSRQPVYNIEYVGDLLVVGDQKDVSNAKKRIGKSMTVSKPL